MAYTVEIRRRALDFIKAQKPKHQKQIRTKIDTLQDDPRPPGSQFLKGRTEYRRIRSGDFRIIYTIDDDKLVVLVVMVGDRKNIYDTLRRAGLID